MPAEVIGKGGGPAGCGGTQGAGHLCRFSVRRSARVRTRSDVRTVKRRERRAPTAASALRWKCRRSGARRSLFVERHPDAREMPARTLERSGLFWALGGYRWRREHCGAIPSARGWSAGWRWVIPRFLKVRTSLRPGWPHSAPRLRAAPGYAPASRPLTTFPSTSVRR